jgi:hypothetical protein
MSDLDDLEEIFEQCSPRVNAPRYRSKAQKAALDRARDKSIRAKHSTHAQAARSDDRRRVNITLAESANQD